MSLGDALRSLPFAVLGLTYFACCAMHSGPIFHTISYAVFCGVPAAMAVTIYSLEGLAGLAGRVLLGMLGDHRRARRPLHHPVPHGRVVPGLRRDDQIGADAVTLSDSESAGWALCA